LEANTQVLEMWYTEANTIAYSNIAVTFKMFTVISKSQAVPRTATNLIEMINFKTISYKHL